MEKKKRGRPVSLDEKSIVLQFRVPKSVYEKIPMPKSEWVRKLIEEKVNGD